MVRHQPREPTDVERLKRSAIPASGSTRLARTATPAGAPQALAVALQRSAGNRASASVLSRKNGKSTGKKRREARAKKESLAIDVALRGARFEQEPDRTATFHRYGDQFRDPEVDPDASGAGGVYQEGRRPEDAPIVDRFREIYNLLDSWILVLSRRRPDLLDQAEKKFALSRRHAITATVKARTKEYKAQFRQMSNLRVYIDEAEFEVFVESQAAELQEMTRDLSQWITSKDPGIDPKTVHTEGTAIWRTLWHKRVTTVNTLIDKLWPAAQKDLTRWVYKQDSIKTKAPIGNLEYIGSLAKGYKGPPKQHVRFNPEDFDIDANLNAPSLAEHALRHDKLTPDRERIFGRQTSIKPLIAFADRMQAEIMRIEGIQDDPEDLFDVALYAPETLEQVDLREEYEDSIAAREQRILAGA